MKKDDYVFTCYCWKDDEIVYINSVKAPNPDDSLLRLEMKSHGADMVEVFIYTRDDDHILMEEVVHYYLLA